MKGMPILWEAISKVTSASTSNLVSFFFAEMNGPLTLWNPAVTSTKKRTSPLVRLASSPAIKPTAPSPPVTGTRLSKEPATTGISSENSKKRLRLIVAVTS
ncbi:hypothetical protein Mal15_01530 [Stieleria maiorica]|uniref:Uncharacterized protein n=1 Tax=Stieleria maiorica TaxID=2795974 RepID=A0A5B9MA72_9BACT|nr:hypothetical protein Mal15_01530 [Stieleria maiorica]